MYIDNKYTKYYYTIINRAKNRELVGYCERHHIIPKSLGGNDLKENLVKLTPKEHHTVHHLLTKMVYGVYQERMIFAYWYMCNCGHYKVNNNQYETAKLNFSKNISNIMKNKRSDPNSSYNSTEYKNNQSIRSKKMWENPDFYLNTEEYRKYISDKIKKLWISPESPFKSAGCKEKKRNYMKEKWKEESFRLYQSECMKNKWRDDNYRDNISAKIKENWKNPEYKYKQSKISSDRWKNPEYRAKYEKKYEVIDPEGETSVITNLKTFCDDRNLSSRYMYALANNSTHRTHYKGWRVKKIE